MARSMYVARPVAAATENRSGFGVPVDSATGRSGGFAFPVAARMIESALRLFAGGAGTSHGMPVGNPRLRGIVVGFEASDGRAIAEDLRDAGYACALRCPNVRELPYIMAVDSSETFVIVNVDAYENLGKAVDELRQLRQGAPRTVVVIASRRVAWHYTGIHRRAIADATLLLPYGPGAFAQVIAAAFENAADARAARAVV